MNRKFLFFFVALLLVQGVVAATVTGSGNKNFNVNWGQRVTSSTFTAVNNTDDVRVYLNGHLQGTVGVNVNSFDTDDFDDQFDGSWDWDGSNSISFNPSDGIDSFTLDYSTTNIFGSDYCKKDNWCSSGEECYYEECCSHDENTDPPIYFVAPTVSSCPDSSIPVETHLNCGDRSTYAPIDIIFYARNVVSGTTTRLSPNNADIDGDGNSSNDECTVKGGVTGWDLDGDLRCGANVDVPTGTYDLTARYTVDGDNYVVDVLDGFVVAPSCGVDVKCGHGGAARLNSTGTGLTTIHYNNPVAEIGEMKGTPAGGYVVAPGTEVRVKGISAINSQCSNGVSYGISQGFVSWSGNNIYDSLKTCDVSGVQRVNLVGDGPSVSDTGYKPTVGVCNLALTQQQNTWLKIDTFNTDGNHHVFMDMVNAICDAPDYICPDLTENNKDRSNLCNLGSMSSSWLRRDGWVPLEEYDFKVVSPNITFVETGRGPDGISVILTYNVKNTGYGDLNVTDAGIISSNNFSASCTDCPVRINEGDTRSVSVRFTMNTTEVLSQVPFSELPFAETCRDDGKIEFEFSEQMFLEFDDSYSFATVLPRQKSAPVDLDLEFDCDPNFPDIDLGEIQCGTYFNITDSLGFNVSVDHPDGLIRGYVDFGDGTNSTNLNYGFNRYLHTYTEPGNYPLVVYVEDLRGGYLTKRSSLMVVDPSVTRDYASACIDKPEDLSNIAWSDIEFDASSSSGLKCVANAGCEYINATGLMFYWTFSDGLTNFNHDGGATDLDGVQNKLAYHFYKNFIQAGANWAKLKVELKP